MASIKDQVRVAFLHDGKDHVNIFTHGVSNVGKVAFPEWRRKFYIPHLGEFASARAFANWCVSGGQEEFRRQTGYVEYRVENIREFRVLMLYAKFFQLTSLRSSLIDEQHLLDVPWMMYKKHLTGVKEHNKWEEYPNIVKAYVAHIVNNGNHVKFDFEAVIPGLTAIVNKYLRAFIGEEFVGIDKIDDLRTAAKPAKAAKAEKQHKRGEAPGVTIVDESGFMPDPAATTAETPAQPEEPLKEDTELKVDPAPLSTAEHDARREQLSAPAEEEASA